MILYVIGPMTGLPGKNFNAFHEAKHQLEAGGYEVLVPTRHEQDGRTQEEYRALGVADVLNADGIATLDGYKKSRGATLEAIVARETGRPVKAVNEWLE